jgi:hypothetical protein
MRALLVASLLTGCASYSAPVRSVGYGAPARLRQGDIEIGGGFVGLGAPVAGSGWLAYALRDWASVEVGADGSVGRWGMGFLGGRFTHAPRRDRKSHGALDGEVGVGLGAGGHRSCNTDATAACQRPWFERVTLGAYLGGGAGYHISFFAIYARGRVQPTVGDGLPRTLWGTAQGGLQFRIAKIVDLFGAAGVSGMVVHLAEAHGFTYDVGLSIRLGARTRRSPKRQ